MHRRFATAMVVVTLLPAPLFAFELLRLGPTCSETQNLFWSPPGAAVDTFPLPADRRALGSDAWQRWNQVLQGFNFRSGSGTVCNSNDGVASLAFSATDCGGADMRNALGVTRLRWNENTGMLIDTDVIFNAESTSLRDDAVFLQVAIHELGHVLGLDHSDACGASGVGTLMRSVLVLTEPRIDFPTGDDIAGANFIYPPPVAPGGSSSGSCAIMPAARTRRPAWVFLSMPFMLVWRRLLVRRSRSGSLVG